MDERDKEIAFREIMAKFEIAWNDIAKDKDLEESLKLKTSVLDVLDNISLHDYLSLLPASVLATIGDHTVDKFTKYYILELLNNLFSYRIKKGQVFLINYHNIAFDYAIENHLLTVYFSVVASERLPGFSSNTKHIQMNPYDLHYTQVSNTILYADYAWGGKLQVPATMLNFTENEIKMWKLSGRQIEFEELGLEDTIFKTSNTIIFSEKPNYKMDEKDRPGFLGVSDSW